MVNNLNYIYALKPTETQSLLLNKSMYDTTNMWNCMVKTMNYAYRIIRGRHKKGNKCPLHGMRGTIEQEYIQLLNNKQDYKGKGIKEIAIKNNLDIENNLDFKKSKSLFNIERAKNDSKIQVYTKTWKHIPKGSRKLHFAARHLACKYALEKINSQKENLFPKKSLRLWWKVMKSWEECCEKMDNPPKGDEKYGAPRWKKENASSTVQWQISPSELKTMDISKFVDLSPCGSIMLKKVKICSHRPIPDNTIIKQMTVTKNSCNKWFVTFSLQGKFEKDFPQNGGNSIGIDPGYKTAFTCSDGKEITKFSPKSLSKDVKLTKKFKFLARQLDRQRRLNNPYFYDEKGLPIKGLKLKGLKYKRTSSMKKTQLAMNKITTHFINARKDFYYNKVNDIYNNYDNVFVGNWTPSTKGKGNKKLKNIGKEHSISLFKSILKYNANLAKNNSKKFYEIDEKNTTQTCSKCGMKSSPPISLSIRNWTCSNPICKAEHDRDGNASEGMRLKGIKEYLTSSANVVVESMIPKVCVAKAKQSSSGELMAQKNCPNWD